MNEEALKDAQNERLERECQNLIKQASKRLSIKGTETCVDCDEPIEPARRKAAPFATRCIDCAREFERGN